MAGGVIDSRREHTAGRQLLKLIKLLIVFQTLNFIPVDKYSSYPSSKKIALFQMGATSGQIKENI